MIVQKWHSWLRQPVFDRTWHESDVADELLELHQAKSLLYKWSEMSDVVYAVSHGRWSGHDLAYPIPQYQVMLGFVYMYPKYTSRAVFFRRAGKKAGITRPLQSVRNPKKIHKLQTIAIEHHIDPKLFVGICQAQARRWPLLP